MTRDPIFDVERDFASAARCIRMPCLSARNGRRRSRRTWLTQLMSDATPSKRRSATGEAYRKPAALAA